MTPSRMKMAKEESPAVSSGGTLKVKQSLNKNKPKQMLKPVIINNT